MARKWLRTATAGRSSSRFPLAVQAAARSSTRFTASVPTAGNGLSSWQSRDARPADCRSRRPNRRFAARASRSRRRSRAPVLQLLMAISPGASPSVSNMAARSRLCGRWRDTWRRLFATGAIGCWYRCRCTKLAWSRGFNQSALVARELSRRLGIVADPLILARIRRTPLLKGMSPLQRRKTGRRRVPGTRQEGGRRENHHPGRRRADDGEYRRGPRADVEASGRRPSGTGQLGARGETFAVDALRLMPKYPAEGNVA
jgi:hypothetical protein